jgi:hypothetical protein
MEAFIFILAMQSELLLTVQYKLTNEPPHPFSSTVHFLVPREAINQWPRYLHNHRLADVVPLAARADPGQESLLQCFSDSLDRLVDAAYESISQDKINVFDQSRINSFIQRRRASDRPLLITLQKTTYKKYKAVWQRLLCFIYRTAQPDSVVQLSHRFTSTQLGRLDRLIVCGEELLTLGESLSPERQKL